VRVLFVCEANRSRTLVAEPIWTRELARRGVPASVSIAGTRPLADAHTSHRVLWAAPHHGLDLAKQCSRPLDDATVDAAHLIVTRMRDQADYVGMHDPRVYGRLFPVSELTALFSLGEHIDSLSATAPLPERSYTQVMTETHLADVLRVAHTRPLMRDVQDACPDDLHRLRRRTGPDERSHLRCSGPAYRRIR
jgi:protein-tyrosine-phosphatase